MLFPISIVFFSQYFVGKTNVERWMTTSIGGDWIFDGQCPNDTHIYYYLRLCDLVVFRLFGMVVLRIWF